MNALAGLMTFVDMDGSTYTRDHHLLMWFSGIVALSLLINAIITLCAGVAAMKAIKEVTRLTHDLHSRATPIMSKTTEIITDLQPKIRSVSENVTQLSYTVRAKSEEVGEIVSQVGRTVSDANAKTRGQVEHVDRMVSTALKTTEDLTHSVVHGIKVPIKQVAGVIAGAKTTYETLIKNFTGQGKWRSGDHDGSMGL